jgi:NifU-like protein involved in Fe-S cluster formation
MLPSKQVLAYFDAAKSQPALSADGCVWEGRAQISSQGEQVKLQLQVTGSGNTRNHVLRARYEVLGGPATIACIAWLAEQVQGLSVAECAKINHQQCIAALQLQATERYAALLAEDALRAALVNEVMA